MAFLIPYALISQGIISIIAIQTCRIVSSIYTYKNPNLNRTLMELDIEKRCKLIQVLVNTINKSFKYNNVDI